LQDIVAGKTVVARTHRHPRPRRAPGEGRRSTPRDTPSSDLTPREMEILCHLAAGKSNKAIARDLGISDGTVKLHVKAILRKLDVRSRVEAAVMAVEQGLCARD
jgi:two-component system nitrate/nitrite response regulator NarL